MKKIIFVVLAVFLLSFGVISAQETETEAASLTFATIGDMISWTTTPQEIYDLLKEYDIEVTAEQDDKYGKTITAEKESEDEYFMYVFYFDDKTESLWEVECVSALYDGDLVLPAFEQLYNEYGFENAEPYENEILAKYAEDFDASFTAAGDSTIALIAASDETEESYGKVALVLINREYFEK